MNWLNELPKYHDRWVSILHYLGEYEFHEDIINETYLRLFNRYGEEGSDIILINEQPNMGLMFTYLSNVRLDYVNSESLKGAVWKSGRRSRGMYKRSEVSFCSMEDVNQADEVNEKEYAYSLFLKKLDTELSKWSDFERKIYKLYVGTFGTQNVKDHGLKRSIRKIAKESHIGERTVWEALQVCRQRIKDNLGEDYEDFLNNDIEHLK